MKITLLFRDRTTACIPLYSNNYRPFTSALLFGLKDAEAMVKFVRGAKAEAKFSDFKIVFVENFEHVSLKKKKILPFTYFMQILRIINQFF